MANNFKGTIKVYPNKSSNYTKEFTVVLFRGNEKDLVEALDGDITNLITFCDNGFKFEDKVARHFGGQVKRGFLREEGIFKTKYNVFSYSEEPNSKIAYKVTVYID